MTYSSRQEATSPVDSITTNRPPSLSMERQRPTPTVETAMNTLPLLALLSLLLLTPPASLAAEQDQAFKEPLDRANELIRSYRHFEAADALKEATTMAGDKHPSLHMRLGILYYGLGLIPEAIGEAQKAVALAPTSKWYKYDLAKFYYVDKQYARAEQQFLDLLAQDPGFTLGYSYLAELYTRNKNYDMAWLSLQRARLLGHQGRRLEEKLAARSSRPTENFLLLPPERSLLRFIKLPSEQEAKNVLAEIAAGKLFENLELELKKDKSGDIDFGLLGVAEVKDAAAAASLRDQVPFAAPTVIAGEGGVLIVQKIAPFDIKAWRALVAAPPSPRAMAGAAPMPPAKELTAPTPQTPPPARKEAIPQASAPTVKEPSAKQPAMTVQVAEPAQNPTEPAAESTQPATASQDMEPSTRALQHLSLQLEAFYALEAWKNAWQAADIAAYLDAYSERFTPATATSLETWKNQRIASLTRPKFIHLKIDNPVVDLQTDDRLQITFTQHFQSDSYRDSVYKALVMVREMERWKISEERILKVLEE